MKQDSKTEPLSSLRRAGHDALFTRTHRSEEAILRILVPPGSGLPSTTRMLRIYR